MPVIRRKWVLILLLLAIRTAGIIYYLARPQPYLPAPTEVQKWLDALPRGANREEVTALLAGRHVEVAGSMDPAKLRAFALQTKGNSRFHGVPHEPKLKSFIRGPMKIVISVHFDTAGHLTGASAILLEIWF